MTLQASVFAGSLTSHPGGLFRSMFSESRSCRWVYDSTAATIGFLMPSTTAPTNYRLRSIASIGPAASGLEVSFFGDENPDDLRVSATSAREWCVDFRADNATSSPGDVVDGQIYLIALIVDNKDWELFINGNSVLAGSTGNAPNDLDLAIGGRNSGGTVDQRIRGQVFAFQFEDADTPANTKTWSFVQKQCWKPSLTEINDQNGLNALTQVNPPVSVNWTNTVEVTQEL